MYAAQGRIQDLEEERNHLRQRVSSLESHKEETDDRFRVVFDLIHKVRSRSFFLLKVC
jgi:uncharacterized coiled-coil DUF342 family protein